MKPAENIPLTISTLKLYLDEEIQSAVEDLKTNESYGGQNTPGFGYSLGYLDALRHVLQVVSGTDEV